MAMDSKSSGEIIPKEYSHEFEWKIDFDSLVNVSNGCKVSSPPFFTNSFDKRIKWLVKIYSRGSASTKEYISIFLMNCSSFEVEASGNFYLLNKDNFKLRQCTVSKDIFLQKKNWGKQLFEKSFLTNSKSCLQTDSGISILCQIIIYRVLNQDYKTFNRVNKLDDFEKIFLNEKFSDFTLISVDKKELHVHKAILANCSPVFEAMFQHNMVENNQNIVQIQDFKYEVLLEMCRFIYSGKVNEIEAMLCDLLRAAEKYCINDLKILCEEIMVEKLNKKNALEYFITAYQNNCSVVKTIRHFIVDHQKDIVNKPEFKLLGVSHLDLMLDIMNDIVYGKNSKN